ncbi:MAG TPA: dihydroorotate dehydrogenase electron transfer subunit [Planctomycetes bacterium]|nr:dihydroorotate dehydrogenase electron transfer subunit [Planctomycetota bacterium]
MVNSGKKASVATVIGNKALKKRFGRLTIQFTGEAAGRFLQVMPGQFVQISLSEAALPNPERISSDLADSAQRQILLRRPFSFCDVTVDRPNCVQVEVLYCVLGPATLRITTLSKGDKISIIGPLGNGFSIPPGKKYALLVAGGMGAPPLRHLATFIRANKPKMRLFAFAGAKSLDDLPFTVEGPKSESPVIPEFSGAGTRLHIATDDGSAGFCGLVTQYMEKWLDESKIPPEDIIVFSCGPEPMLAEVARLSEKYGIDCQVSMERMMACGIGLCQSCAVECKGGTKGETVYKLCCKDGPVFNGREVVFESR